MDFKFDKRSALTPISISGKATVKISTIHFLSSSSLTPNDYIMLNKNSKGFVE